MGQKSHPGTFARLINSFNIHLEYAKSLPTPNGLTHVPVSLESERLLKTTLHLLECLDVKISMYVYLGGQGAGRREKEDRETNTVMLESIYMSVKFFNF